jgi:hypothetical protein
LITKTIDGTAGICAVPTKTTYIDYVDDICETGHYSKTITITATCNKGCDSKPTGVPQGYTTSTVHCSVCKPPSDVVVTYKQGEEWHTASATGKPAAAANESAGPSGKHGADASAALAPVGALAPVKSVDPAGAKPKESTAPVAPSGSAPGKPAESSPEGDGAAGGKGKIAGYTGDAVVETVGHSVLVLAMAVGFWVLYN